MPRGATRRTWVKFYVTGWLHGGIRWQLSPDERGTFADLLVLAGECGKEGAISDNDGRPFPQEFIASQLNIQQELLHRTIEKCVHEGRIVLKDGVIVIANWKVYQSEYERQKPYRTQKGLGGASDDPDKYIKGKYGHMVQK